MKRSHILIAFLLVIDLMGPATADQYPSRPVTIIVPYAAGGATDIVARLVAKGLWDELGQSFNNEVGGKTGESTYSLQPTALDPQGDIKSNSEREQDDHPRGREPQVGSDRIAEDNQAGAQANAY